LAVGLAVVAAVVAAGVAASAVPPGSRAQQAASKSDGKLRWRMGMGMGKARGIGEAGSGLTGPAS